VIFDGSKCCKMSQIVSFLNQLKYAYNSNGVIFMTKFMANSL